MGSSFQGTPPNLPDLTPDLANLDQSELDSNQEATVVPYFAGQRKIALTWIAPIYGLVQKKIKGQPPAFSQDVPNKELQEREIGALYFLLKYGKGFVAQLKELADGECVEHQVIRIAAN